MAKRGIPAGTPDFDLKTAVGGKITRTTGWLGSSEPTTGRHIVYIVGGVALLLATLATIG